VDETKKEGGGSAGADTAAGKGNKKKKKISLIILIVLVVIGAITVYFYLRYKATHISTDDAFVEGHVHTIASKVSGTVKKINVRDNQLVTKGDVLVEIDPADYEVKVKEASSSLGKERSKLSEIEAKIGVSKQRLSELNAASKAAKANLELQEANLKLATIDFNRAEKLYEKEAIPRERYDNAKTGYEVAVSRVKAAGEQAKQAEMAVETQKAIIKQSEAAKPPQISTIKEKEAKLKAAELNYGYTHIPAPSDGYITKKTVEVGNQIEAGLPLMAVVPLDNIWVIANYKETQLEKVKPGQRVEMKVDTYPKKTFNGKVDSIMAGSGAVFSLFPPENATGNYVKVVQRIPVKIVLERGTDPHHVLRIGMSVTPTILIENEGVQGFNKDH
jgi:membrane fusion protein (multidrug efflux system)